MSNATGIPIGGPGYPGATPPPPGRIPDLAHPIDAGRIANITGLIICDVIVTVLFVTRGYVKLRLTRKLLVEDVTCTLAWAGVLFYSALVLVMTNHGEGHHSWEISPREYSQMLKWLYASSIVYCPVAFFAKATLLLLMARVFAVKERVARGIYVFIGVLFIAYIPLQILKILICRPIRAYWDPFVEGHHCFNQRRLFLVDLAYSIVTDLLILLVPIPLTWKLRMSIWKKIKIVALLGAGGVATAVTIYRLVRVVNFLHTRDVASDYVLIDLLTMIELSIGVACSCLPAVNILIERHCSTRLSGGSERSPCSPQAEAPAKRKIDAFGWHQFGATISSYRENTTAGVSHASSSKDDLPITFDLELAMLSANGGGSVNEVNRETVAAAAAIAEEIDTDDWFKMEKANSRDGRREGWLDPGQAPQPQDSTEEEQNSNSSGHKSAGISNELARVSGNRPWSRIWDGRGNGTDQPKKSDVTHQGSL